MYALSLPFLHRLSSYAPVVIRVLVGAIMTAHGWQKLADMGPATFGSAMLEPNGVPLASLVGWLVTGIELVGGIMLIVGLATRIAAALISAVLLGAIILVKVDIGFLSPIGAMLPGAELDVALLAGTFALMLMGPGRPSVDHAMGIEPGLDRAELVA